VVNCKPVEEGVSASSGLYSVPLGAAAPENAIPYVPFASAVTLRFEIGPGTEAAVKLHIGQSVLVTALVVSSYPFPGVVTSPIRMLVEPSSSL
jgi:hypothetical protein